MLMFDQSKMEKKKKNNEKKITYSSVHSKSTGTIVCFQENVPRGTIITHGTHQWYSSNKTILNYPSNKMILNVFSDGTHH